MRVISETDFNLFKNLLKTDKNLAILGLKTNSISPQRTILVETDKWKGIIHESFNINKRGNYYLKRTKSSEIIYGKKYLYVKDSRTGGLKTISPFNGINDTRLIETKEIYDYYKLDFLYPYKNFLQNEKLSFIQKNKITNFEDYFKLKYKYIPYNLFKKELINKLNLTEIQILNNILSNAKNPNSIVLFNVEIISKRFIYNNMLSDLISMSKIFNEKINLLWSEKRIKLEHDLINKRITEVKKKFVKNEKLNVGEIFNDLLPKEFELIDDRLRLFEEGEELKHCVYNSGTYYDSIQKGTCGIYSIVHNKERFTLDLRFDNTTHKISINQFRGYSNKNAPQVLFNMVNNILEKNNLIEQFELVKINEF